jgi:putative acetyltransferase
MLEIRSLQSQQAQEAKEVVADVCLHTFEWPVSLEELLTLWELSGELVDIDEAQTYYFQDGGLFLVLVDAERVVGTGAIRRLSTEVCELKRMYLYADYQRQGLGRQLAELLLEFAGRTGYQKVRLDVYQEDKQSRALRFYETLGFYRIERYNDSPCSVFMEKRLNTTAE